MVLEGGCCYLTNVVDRHSVARVIVGGVACFEDETQAVGFVVVVDP
jgi:hypothetical protein